MRALVTGGSGMIGSRMIPYLLERGHEVSYTFLTHEYIVKGCKSYRVDVRESQSTAKLIEEIGADIIIHTVALTNVDLCETDPELARRVNIEGTMNVIRGCQKANSKALFVSSSFVFDGNKSSYSEEDIPHTVNSYGYTKLEGERIIASSGLPFIILRTDQPYCWTKKWQRRTSVERVLAKLDAGGFVKDIIDWYNTPTFVDNFVEVAVKLMEGGKEGIYHVVGSDFINRYEWALKVADIFGKDRTLVHPMNSEELKLPTKRPNVNLSNLKAQKETGIKLVGVEEGLKLMLKQLESIRA